MKRACAAEAIAYACKNYPDMNVGAGTVINAAQCEAALAAGAKFISCDDCDMEKKLNPKDSARLGKDMAFSVKILVDTTLALDDKILGEMTKLNPDCIVADSMALWGKAIALKLGIPFVSSTTTFAFNQHSARIMEQGIGDFFKMLFSMPKAAAQVKRLRDKGYPVKSILDIIGNDENVNTISVQSIFSVKFSSMFTNQLERLGIDFTDMLDDSKRDNVIDLNGKNVELVSFLCYTK